MKLTENFDLIEFQSHDGVLTPSAVLENLKILAQNLEVLRKELKAKIFVNSGYRSPEHNKRIGGVDNSQHLLGNAADIKVNGYSPRAVYMAIERLIAKGKMKQGGLGLYNGFVHYDIRGTKARWRGKY